MERVATVLIPARRPAVLLALLLCVAVLGVGTGGGVGLVLKFLLGRIAYSTSNAAALLTLGFGLAVLLHEGDLRRVAWNRWFGGALLAGYVVHFVMLCVVLSRHGLTEYDFAIFWGDGRNSFNALTHSHVGKAGLAVLADLLGVVEGYDTGTVFLSQMPAVVAVLLAMTFLVALVAGVGWTCCMLKVHAAHPAMQWLAALGALGAVKSQLDGGWLSGAGFAALAVVGVFLRYADATALLRFWRRHGIRYAIVLGVAYVAATRAVLPSAPPLPPFLGAMALYGCLVIVGLHGGRRMVLWAMAAYLALLAWVEFEADVLPLLRPLPSGALVWTIDARGELGEPLTATYFEGSNLAAVYRRLGDDPLKPSSVLVATPGMEGSGRIEVDLITSEILPIHGRISPPVSGWRFASVSAGERGVLGIAMVSSRAGLPPMQSVGTGTVVTRNNFNVYLHWLAKRLSVAGWRRWTMGIHSSH